MTDRIAFGPRGWGAFLTAADQAHIAHSSQGKHVPFGLGERPALILVDIYREALGTRETTNDLDTWPMSCGDSGWEATDRTSALLEAARASGIKVIHTTAAAELPTRWGSSDPDHANRDFTIVEEVAPREDEIVIRKSAPSGFNGTPLSFELNANGIDTIVICGEATSGCVRATAVDAATLRYRVAVVEDCCFDRIEASHWMNLFDIDQKYGDVITSKAAIEYFMSRSPQQRGELNG